MTLKMLSHRVRGHLLSASLIGFCASLAFASSSLAQNGATLTMPVAPAAVDTAVFAGGCFWCMEPPFDRLPGVLSTTSGYTGGTVANPTYEQVSSGGTGHVEVVRVIYDPLRVSYTRLLDVFWRNIDPVTPNRQFCDAGDMYRSAIFPQNPGQHSAAVASKAALERSRRFNQPIVTEIAARSEFYPAEEYHQDYYAKNPIRYKFYRRRCGRDSRLEKLWGKPGPARNIESNVRDQVRKLGIVYPVVMDNSYTIWNSFGNRYWPPAYVVDATGRNRFHHFGEGRYDEQDRVVASLLAEAKL